MSERYDVAIVSGGIMATAQAPLRLLPNISFAALEAKNTFRPHQSGHNSNVIHTGIYSEPASPKAKMARTGGERQRVADGCTGN